MPSISSVCIKENLIRSSYYSDTYRATFTMNGEKKERDVQHISLPFPAEKEIMLKHRFGFDQDELPGFYAYFGERIKHSFKVNTALREIKDSNLDTCTFYFERKFIAKKEMVHGSDIYIVSSPSESLTNSSILTDSGTTLHNILRLGVFLLKFTKYYANNGCCLGTIDLDSYIIDQADGRFNIKSNYLYYATSPGITMDDIGKDAYAFLPPNVVSGNVEISPNSDVYAVCALLWTLLDGRHFTDKPDFTHYPRYIPTELGDKIYLGMSNGELSRKEVSNALRDALKTIDDAMIPFRQPEYMADAETELAKYKEMHTSDIHEEDDIDDDEEDDEEVLEADEEDHEIFLDRMSRKAKLVSVASLLLFAGIVISSSLYAGKILGEKGWRTHQAVSVETVFSPVPTIEVYIPQVVNTPAPIIPPTAIAVSEYPTLTLKTDYEWFRSEYPPTDYCAIEFCDIYRPQVEVLESWNFYLDESSIHCYVYKRPSQKTDIECNPNAGDKVLVIAGNGTGRINIAMNQQQLSEYMKYKFTHAVLNGISGGVLNVTGSTPFQVPIEEPAIQQTPLPHSTNEDDIPADPAGYPNQNAAESYQSPPDNTQVQTNNYGYSTNSWNGNSGYSAEVQQAVQQIQITNNVTQTDAWGDTVATKTFSLTASNTSVNIGTAIAVWVSGEIDGNVSIWSDNPSVIQVSSFADANGCYQVSGINRGTANIYASVSSYSGQAVLEITCR